jgi:hypothetical protein
MADEMQLFWGDKLIGTLPDPKVDNFFLYGRWTRLCNQDEWQQLLDVLDATGEVEVGIRRGSGPLKGRILVEPDDEEIEIRLDPQG